MRLKTIDPQIAGPYWWSIDWHETSFRRPDLTCCAWGWKLCNLEYDISFSRPRMPRLLQELMRLVFLDDSLYVTLAVYELHGCV